VSAGPQAAPSPHAVLPHASDLARILASALAADIRDYPDGTPVEPSATQATVSARRRAERIVSGRLHEPRVGHQLLDRSPGAMG
jgi:hypothetical protein